MTGRLVFGRAAQAALTLLGASLFFYVLVYLIPGDPIRALFGFRPPPPELLAELRGRYGLDDPFYLQYLKYLTNLVRGDLGHSFRGVPVSRIIAAAAPVSLRLIAATAVIQIGFGIAAGVLASMRRRSFVSQLLWVTTAAMVAIPVFALAYLVQDMVATRFRFFPTYGLRGWWRGYFLPAAVLGSVSAAYVARMTIIELRATNKAPFVVAARARGVSHSRVVAVHSLRAAAGPVVTLIGANLSQFLTGLILVEGIFRLPGLGSAVFEAVRSKDHAVVVGILVVSTLFVVLVSVVTDVVAAILDPRMGPG